ncbi:hypothetical protein CLV42_113143 [Chitinophaga ginsengisoli]|uniref:Uncharacterized protein n=1 Tax=Chitinophaga ginsengisoli TaxID=363837 RepID=A0A2P8FUS1_9BACT|nr:hypothetical protein CLV42_113143 [Chitinophaga ginsengisoli]
MRISRMTFLLSFVMLIRKKCSKPGEKKRLNSPGSDE